MRVEAVSGAGGGGVGYVGPAEALTSLLPHPSYEEEPRDHGIEAPAIAGALVGLDAAPTSAWAVAGGEDGGQVLGSCVFR